MRIDVGDALLLLFLAFAVSGIFALYRMATDPRTRLREPDGKEIDPAELEEDEPREMRD